MSATAPSPSIDWSSFWPDMIVALFTGLVIGAVLLIAERILDGKRRAREVSRSQRKAARDCARWVTPTLQYSGDSLMPLDLDLTRIDQRMKEVGEGEGDSFFAEYEFLRQMLHQWDLMKIVAGKIELRAASLITLPDPWASDERQALRQYLHQSFREKPRLWAEYWAEDHARGLVDDARLIADVKEYLVQRTMFEGCRRAYLASRDAFESGYNALINERVDAAMERYKRSGRKPSRPRPVRKKAVRQVRHDATLAGQRVVRTLHAKADHRIEYMFGRRRYQELLDAASPEA
ncbi:hypothetical protein [Microbacterium sp. NPDC058389]|uniref:hypothetical protein n=1 Tax=Microbacterium sp. NPDC058389 TaxID=3346475 RepID=UPI003665F46C